MKIKNIEEENRPREKLIKNGPSSLTNEELLAIILRCGNKNQSVLELSKQLLSDIANISYLKDLTYQELTKFSGIKKAKASVLLACFEIAKRCYSYYNNSDVFGSGDDIFNHMNPILSNEKKENFYALFLDTKCHLISKKLISTGSVNQVFINNQDIIRSSLKYSAFSVVLVHNHPSGDIMPSRNDIDTTNLLKQSLELVGVILLDHIIIGGNSYFSFAQKNIL